MGNAVGIRSLASYPQFASVLAAPILSDRIVCYMTRYLDEGR